MKGFDFRRHSHRRRRRHPHLQQTQTTKHYAFECETYALMTTILPVIDLDCT
jgi:hypothetical protein